MRASGEGAVVTRTNVLLEYENFRGQFVSVAEVGEQPPDGRGVVCDFGFGEAGDDGADGLRGVGLVARRLSPGTAARVERWR